MDKTLTEALALMDARVHQMMKSDPGIRSREAAIARVASAPTGSVDWAIWHAYKAVAGAVEAMSEPSAGANGVAYALLEKKAHKLRKRDPSLSEAGAFAMAYKLNPELATAQRNEHLARTMTVAKVAPQPALNAYQMLKQEREAHIVKAMSAAVRVQRS